MCQCVLFSPLSPSSLLRSTPSPQSYLLSLFVLLYSLYSPCLFFSFSSSYSPPTLPSRLLLPLTPSLPNCGWLDTIVGNCTGVKRLKVFTPQACNSKELSRSMEFSHANTISSYIPYGIFGFPLNVARNSELS